MVEVKDQDKFKMTLNLNVLNHLGINLYSNMPSVLQEIVANAWDADAKNVRVTLDKDDHKIVIQDDGHGMTVEDLNIKFLQVGYQRRENNEAITKKYKRKGKV